MNGGIACLLALLILGAAGLAPLRPARAESGADAVIEVLAAADRARAALAREQAEWALERDRQQALADALAAEARRLDGEVARLRAQAAELRETAASDALAERIAEKRAEAQAVDSAIRGGLAPLAPRWSPPAAAPGLPGALALLRAAEQAATAVEVGVVTGELDGQTVAVQTVRLGLAAMWWRALDGGAAGRVEVVDGRRILHRGAPAEQRAVIEALAVAGGQVPPRLIDLPVAAPSDGVGRP